MAAISKELQVTDCPVCLDPYTDPKILPCAHLLCHDCLVNMMKTRTEVLCPLCRCVIVESENTACEDFVDSLPTDLALCEMVKSATLSNENPVCHVHNQVKAVALCLHCKVTLCQTCIEVHAKLPISASHKIKVMSQIAPEIFAANSQPPEIFAANSQPPEIFAASSQPPEIFTANSQPPEIFAANSQPPEIFTANSQPPEIFTANSQPPEIFAANSQPHCSVHPDKTSEVFCSNHKVFVCQVCAITIHRVCPAVVCLKAVLEQYKQSLTEMEAKLSEAKSIFNQAIRTFDACLQKSEENTKIAYDKTDETCDRLLVLVENSRRRLKRLVQDVEDEIKENILHRKSLVVQKHDRLTSHLLLLKRIQNMASINALRNMVPDLESRIDKLDTDPTMYGRTFYFTAPPLGINEEALMRVEQELECIGELDVSAFSDDEKIHWCFHTNHGKNIRLTNNRQTATLIDNWYGSVISSLPLQINKLYEMEVQEMDKEHDVYIAIGVVMENPANIILPKESTEIKSAFVIRSDQVCHGTQPSRSLYGETLNNINVDSRVGLAIDTNLRIHLYVDGDDQGVIHGPVKQPCYAIIDFSNGFVKKATCLPLVNVL